MKQRSRNFFILIGILILLAIMAVVSVPQQKTEAVSLSKLIQEAKSGNLSSIEVSGDKLTGTQKKSGTPLLTTNKEAGATLKDYGIDYSKVKIETKSGESTTRYILAGLFSILPFVLIG
ncbi:MAG TPA: ATP-dependent metallopeptidase FtsH/Yme1/Tma family protein, partial [Candidatus Polarisedimenticolaceae bacterium]|nr:ATP-dependent metallopeptidase FtsH/Yme1/Tma family protein [Candidatus Polarisedimenticolaceae bacterium]